VSAPWEALLPSAAFSSGLTRNPLSTRQSSSQSCATRVLHRPPKHARRTKSRVNITTESSSLIEQNGTPFSTRFNHEQLEPDDDLLLVTDLFCGAGGTSTGILKAGFLLRRNMQLLAINHWPSAIATHSLNHPHVRHLCESLDSIDPRKQVKKLHLLAASPECTHHSSARGGKPGSSRFLMGKQQGKASSGAAFRADSSRPAAVEYRRQSSTTCFV
jgi:hypothetical protein